ncbi:hypothetical protein CDAR_24141 [Caerostris darwini]|uniref:Uncharacterized protein n=1 Tax=Caerostris darwini TaxID=1538125 RepID=A0AAV4QKG6_9ARAC|nr:hypothetical protein CDAR_24141 [Caerostris darwini]
MLVETTFCNVRRAQGTRKEDSHPTDIIGSSRKYKGQKTTKNYNYTWYPGCREVITKSYDELYKVLGWKIQWANDTTMGSGLAKQLQETRWEQVKYPPQLFSKQVEFARFIKI